MVAKYARPEIRKRVLDELFGDWEEYKHNFNKVEFKAATLEKLINRTIRSTIEELEKDNYG